MSRTTLFKILYVTLLLLISMIVLYVYVMSEHKPLVFLVTLVIFLLPGRIQGYYWREFYNGRKLLSKNNFEDSINLFESFMKKTQKSPWLKKLIWLNWGFYTRDIEVMALNNIGAAHMSLGNLEDAAVYFDKAIEIDPLCPLPYYNYAILGEIKSDQKSAQDYFRKAEKLGYKQTTIDRFIHQAGEKLADWEGKDTK